MVELQSLNPQGSDVVVALSTLDGKLTKQVWSDGRAVGKPSSMPWYQLKQPTPEATKTIRGVEVVSRYGPGSAALPPRRIRSLNTCTRAAYVTVVESTVRHHERWDGDGSTILRW